MSARLPVLRGHASHEDAARLHADTSQGRAVPALGCPIGPVRPLEALVSAPPRDADADADATSADAVSVEHEVPHRGLPGHIRLRNRHVELLLSTAYGPRVVRYAPLLGENIFAEMPPSTNPGKPTPFGEPWHIYGGHRLWHAPEDPVRTYVPDNRPVNAVVRGATVSLVQEVEARTGLRKSLEVTLDAASSRVTVLHRIENAGLFEVELAVWALSVLAPGGVGLFPNAPFKPFPEQIVPSHPLVLWPYTRLNDPRWSFGDRIFQLRQDPASAAPQKLGFHDGEGWLAYRRGDVLFVKQHPPKPGPHADFGCNVETFTNAAMLELETLSPLTRIAPGAAVEHVERWSLAAGVDFGEGEAGLVRAIGNAIGNAIGDAIGDAIDRQIDRAT